MKRTLNKERCNWGKLSILLSGQKLTVLYEETEFNVRIPLRHWCDDNSTIGRLTKMFHDDIESVVEGILERPDDEDKIKLIREVRTTNDPVKRSGYGRMICPLPIGIASRQ